ncbi:hypothetical protein PAAG_12307 [Paracoccidioides lutzii Pb01]|uniref:Uncharacterized protein n=1 Tax=Paracoccidioides lutzii (strain ATCC MYA-826 / Pb01) TaxID=502779 RepID=A0A0A2VJA9_PARBA|nr:hypothetical protein PAAG_12307 [Paracoccidioides lutzii Pb01]KGQ00999.1 hypothetical protein PAAG_12307 [Paracoccidioides lutzii Pb01]
MPKPTSTSILEPLTTTEALMGNSPTLPQIDELLGDVRNSICLGRRKWPSAEGNEHNPVVITFGHILAARYAGDYKMALRGILLFATAYDSSTSLFLRAALPVAALMSYLKENPDKVGDFLEKTPTLSPGELNSPLSLDTHAARNMSPCIPVPIT